jgi:hypothetical protein
MKNAVFWDVNPSSYLTGGTLRLRYRAQPVNAKKGLMFFTAVTIKNPVFSDIKRQFLIHNKQYFSTTDSSQLKL